MSSLTAQSQRVFVSLVTDSYTGAATNTPETPPKMISTKTKFHPNLKFVQFSSPSTSIRQSTFKFHLALLQPDQVLKITAPAT